MKTTAFLLLGFLVASTTSFAETRLKPDYSGGYKIQEDGVTTGRIRPDYSGGYVIEDDGFGSYDYEDY